MAVEKRSRTEILAKEALADHLRLQHSETHLIWSCPDLDPPDFNLVIRDCLFAVEVTSVTGAANPDVDGNFNQIAFVKATQTFAKRIERLARSSGVLDGTYHISFGVIADFGEQRERFESALLSFIGRTQLQEAAGPETVYSSNGGHLSIAKIGSSPDGVFRGAIPRARWQGEALDELSRMLNESVQDKRHKLRSVAKPWVLLLVDRYLFAEGGDWNKAIREIEGITEFHLIARVHSGPLQILAGDGALVLGAA